MVKLANAGLGHLMLAVMSVAGWSSMARAQACPEVNDARELLIRDLGVVEDATRTTGDGVWTFKHLMEAMAPSTAEAPGMVEQMLSTWLTDQTINDQIVAARPQLRDLVLDPWPRVDGALDLGEAPVRLLAIVNRLDLRSLSKGQAGEGRFVFGVTDSSGRALQFTMIFEYKLPASSEAEVLEWANRWHGLGTLVPGSPEYNTALELITERFAGANANPGGVNGSALNQIRTNEVELGFPWELREFTLSDTGLLQPDTVKLTPDSSFMSTPATLAAFVNQFESEILVERHDVPASFEGVPFLGGSSLNNLDAWVAPGIVNNEARHKFSLNTCNGCHGLAETGTFFLHISPRDAGVQADISGFLSGVDVADPVDQQNRHFDDLDRRATDMEQLLCTPSNGPQRRTANASIAEGIGRVH